MTFRQHIEPVVLRGLQETDPHIQQAAGIVAMGALEQAARGGDAWCAQYTPTLLAMAQSTMQGNVGFLLMQLPALLEQGNALEP
jgi:hypothetical protein